jgi:hypothetical protein
MQGVSQVSSADPLKNITGFLGGSDSTVGTNMLSSILGSNTHSITSAISKNSGLSTGVVGKILSMAMPLLLGALGKNLKKHFIRRPYEVAWGPIQIGFISFA